MGAGAVVGALNSGYRSRRLAPPEFDHAQGLEPVADRVLEQFGRAAVAHTGGRAWTTSIDLSQWQYLAEKIFRAIGFVDALGERAREAAALGFTIRDGWIVAARCCECVDLLG